MHQHQQNKAVLCSVNSINELARLLHTDQRRLQLMASRPSYKAFSIPKKNGGERLIEAPASDLKKVLGILNRYLQSTYLFEKSCAAYGFVTGAKNDEDRRNVLTNARKHLGKPYLLNIDLEDFFHSVTQEQVLKIFQETPFRLKRELPELLANLCTYHGRLPMGTPTSPVLSNFACRDLDQELIKFSEDMLWTFTRYADDMSFSAAQPIPGEKIETVCTLIEKAKFKVNTRKVKVYGANEPKIVTGLFLDTNEVTLAPDYLDALEAEIVGLQAVMKAQNEQGQLTTRWVEQLKQQIRGRLNFAGFVLPRMDARFSELKDAFHTAINPAPEEFGAVSWRSFPYNF